MVHTPLSYFFVFRYVLNSDNQLNIIIFQLFKSFEGENKGKIKVFFCGAPQLGKIIKEAAERFSFAFSKENF